MTITDGELAVAAAQAGAAVVRARYGTALERFGKGGGDFATAADIEAEQAIHAVLRAARPGDAFVGEETGQTGDAPRTWLVDPLCGTLNFAARTPLVAVNVALRTAAGVTAAASADPFAGEVFWTDGDGAFRRRDGRDEPLVPDAGSALAELDVDPPTPNGPAFLAERLLLEPSFRAAFRPRVLSTSLGLLWVADGRRAVYVIDRDLRDDVHFAAGIAVCRAAGCALSGLRGEPVGAGAHGLVAAADAGTHTAVLAAVAAVWAGV
ncbi:inositol monophosphatase family protein [Dactylosporangium sucinum]|uniref:Phosphatase n=1 Tax=Dactylosporangium sucinum TaxID=1424081 RepID=A0A917TVQ1_9ACTN|nr:inositol monophosphatase family protein [Dactylosporangium sucinum]GGM40352.1 phosphatase [Dactylosporangium sucinum]